MAPLPPEARFATHAVKNQPLDLMETDLFAGDPAPLPARIGTAGEG